MVNHTETKQYLEEVLAAISTLRIIVAHKKKTLKTKAFSSILDLLKSRVSAKIEVLKAAINDDTVTVGAKVIQQELYQPIIDYLTKELSDE